MSELLPREIPRDLSRLSKDTDDAINASFSLEGVKKHNYRRKLYISKKGEKVLSFISRMDFFQLFLVI